MRVAVIGAGHVGLVTAVTLAALGHDVEAVDADAEKMALLRQRKPPFFEPGLEEILREQVAAGRVSFEHDTVAAILGGAAVVIICVGTPPNPDGEANIAAIERSAEDIARHADDGVVVVGKSTVPAGTGERIREIFGRERPANSFSLVSNPEFLREGSAVKDALEPDRLLIGAEDLAGFEAMRELYAPLIQRGVRLIETDLVTAELAKHASNAFLTLKISYANALARICERAGADVEAVTEVMGSDPRIGRAFLGAGLGYGGYCLPKDVAAFERLADRLGYPFPMLSEAVRINEEAVEVVLDRIREAIDGVSDRRIALLGLAFKSRTDDVRLSPALALAARLLDLGAEVVGYDPEANSNAKAKLPRLRLAADPYEAAGQAQAIVLATAWPEFRELDLARLREAAASPVFVDARNAMDGQAVADAGFWYLSIGRPALQPAPEPAP